MGENATLTMLVLVVVIAGCSGSLITQNTTENSSVQQYTGKQELVDEVDAGQFMQHTTGVGRNTGAGIYGYAPTAETVVPMFSLDYINVEIEANRRVLI